NSNSRCVGIWNFKIEIFKKMYLEIVSPEALLVSGDIESVTVPGVEGEFQMLDNHAAIVSLLGKGKVKFKGNATIAEGHESKFIQEDRKSTRLNSSHVKISYA